MRLSLLGSGDAGGTPLYGCDCEHCQFIRINPQHSRKSASALLEIDNKHYLIDAGLMDIATRFPAPDLDGILLTHFHADHVQGLFHLRWGKGKKIPVHCPPDSEGCADLFKHPGILDFQAKRKYESFNMGELKITPLPLIHSKPTFGYLFEYKQRCIAYLVDTKDIPPKVEELLIASKLDKLVIDTCVPSGIENRNHNNLDDALSLHERLKPQTTIMTHIGHDLDVWLHNNKNHLIDSVVPGHDGYIIFDSTL